MSNDVDCIRVLGVDTSLRSSGIGVVEQCGNKLRALQYGLIKNPQKRCHSESLSHIAGGIREILASEKPDVVAVEGIFYCKNVRTAVTLGQARGVVLSVCADAGLPIYEYAPRRVKQAIVGYGGATKEQVIQMVSRLLNLQTPPSDDAADALAIAMCHLQNSKLPPEVSLIKRI